MIVRVIDLTGRTVPLTVRVDDDTLSAELLNGGSPTNVHVHALTDAEFHDVRRRGMFAGTALHEKGPTPARRTGAQPTASRTCRPTARPGGSTAGCA